jgi:uncharacterized protein
MSAAAPIVTAADSLRAKAAPIIEEATRRLVEEFQPEQVWLFGSYAWGEPTADSDLDLLVIVPESDERPLRRMQRAHRCLSRLGMSKDVLVSTAEATKRFGGLRSTLTHKIFAEGRQLYGR